MKLRVSHKSFSGTKSRKRLQHKANNSEFNFELFIGTFAITMANRVVNPVNVGMEHIAQL
jgi:hypothetical protein